MSVPNEGQLTQEAIRINRLKALSWKMLNHREWFAERMYEHHSSEEGRAHCTKCWEYQCQYDRWAEKWWKLYQQMPRVEEVTTEQQGRNGW